MAPGREDPRPRQRLVKCYWQCVEARSVCMSRREGRCRGAERGVKLEYGTGSMSTTGSSKVQSVAVPWEDGIYLT